jgi:hypothetical protein
MKAPAIPMRRSPTTPNPVPCTIWPASHPAMRPTTNMIRRLSPDMCIFVSSSCISKLTNFRPLRRREIHHQRRARPKVTIRFFKEDWDHPLVLVKHHANEDCAKLLTLRRSADLSTCRLLAHINVFIPEPIQSGGANYACRHRHRPGPRCVNEVKVDESAAV